MGSLDRRTSSGVGMLSALLFLAAGVLVMVGAKAPLLYVLTAAGVLGVVHAVGILAPQDRFIHRVSGIMVAIASLAMAAAPFAGASSGTVIAVAGVLAALAMAADALDLWVGRILGGMYISAGVAVVELIVSVVALMGSGAVAGVAVALFAVWIASSLLIGGLLKGEAVVRKAVVEDVHDTERQALEPSRPAAIPSPREETVRTEVRAEPVREKADPEPAPAHVQAAVPEEPAAVTPARASVPVVTAVADQADSHVEAKVPAQEAPKPEKKPNNDFMMKLVSSKDASSRAVSPKQSQKEPEPVQEPAVIVPPAPVEVTEPVQDAEEHVEGFCEDDPSLEMTYEPEVEPSDDASGVPGPDEDGTDAYDLSETADRMAVPAGGDDRADVEGDQATEDDAPPAEAVAVEAGEPSGSEQAGHGDTDTPEEVSDDPDVDPETPVPVTVGPDVQEDAGSAVEEGAGQFPDDVSEPETVPDVSAECGPAESDPVEGPVPDAPIQEVAEGGSDGEQVDGADTPVDRSFDPEVPAPVTVEPDVQAECSETVADSVPEPEAVPDASGACGPVEPAVVEGPETETTVQEAEEEASDAEQVPETDVFTDYSPEALVRRAAWNKGLRCRRGYGDHNIPVAFVKGRVAVYVEPADADRSIDDLLVSEGWTVLRYDEAAITDGKAEGEEILAAVRANMRTVKSSSKKRKTSKK